MINVEYEPCMDPFQQSSSVGELYYGPEMMKSGCTIEKNSRYTTDPRY